MSRLRRGWSGGVCLVVTMHLRRALGDRSAARDPLTCMFSSRFGVYNQNSATTSGNALAPTFLTCTRIPCQDNVLSAVSPRVQPQELLAHSVMREGSLFRSHHARGTGSRLASGFEGGSQIWTVVSLLAVASGGCRRG